MSAVVDAVVDGGDVLRLACPCGRHLATVELVSVRVPYEWTEENPEIPVGADDRVVYVPSTRHDDEKDVVVGHPAKLAPGFVNAKGRHPSGLAWYVRGRADRRPRVLPVRLPAVATCACGRVVRLNGPTDVGPVGQKSREAIGDDLGADAAHEAAGVQESERKEAGEADADDEAAWEREREARREASHSL